MASNFYLWSLQTALLHKYYERLCFSMTQVDGAATNSPACFQLFNFLHLIDCYPSTKPRTIKKAARWWNRLCSCWPRPVYLGEKGHDHHHVCKHLIIDPNFDLEPRPDCSSAVTTWNQTCWLLCGSVKLKVYWYKCVINVLHAEGAFTNRMDTKRHKFTTIRSKRETNQLSAVFISNRRVQKSNNTDLILTLQ